MGLAAPSSASTTYPLPPLVVSLDAELAQQSAVAGSKASALARAAAAGLRTVPGVVLTTAFAASLTATDEVADQPGARQAFALADGEHHRLIVRSSSVAEDTSTSSMAGQFLTVADVNGAAAFSAAVSQVLRSAGAPGARQPMAVLVQRMLEPAISGVMFGVDPVTGRSDRVVITAVEGRPHRLVDGSAAGSQYELRHDAKITRFAANDGPRIPSRDLRRLLRLEARTRQLFGAPQDVEWAIDPAGTLWLLQSRPVTTPVKGTPRGPVYGPGPVAETFPEPLTELEQDLWVPPLRDAVREASLLAGHVPRRQLSRSDFVVALHGHVAIDLQLAGEMPRPRRLVTRLDPRPAGRRLAAAWRVGRLKQALPRLAENLLDRVDADLQQVPRLSELTERQLIVVLHRARSALRSLHAHEVLMGLMTDARGARLTGASLALRVLAEARAEGLDDAEIVERNPVVLALAPPRIGPAAVLPRKADVPPPPAGHPDIGDSGVLREALRLRVRWVHELTGRVAWELGARAAAAGDLVAAEHVRHLTLEQLTAVTTGRARLLTGVVAAHRHDDGEPLPARFQLSELGHPITLHSGRDQRGGTGAGGGVGLGRVTHDADDPPAGSVLVTVTLRPGIGPVLSRLNGIVAETGSVLSHLAIMAREAGVPVVVGYVGATGELAPGALVSVDGSTGQVVVQQSGHQTGQEPAATP